MDKIVKFHIDKFKDTLKNQYIFVDNYYSINELNNLDELYDKYSYTLEHGYFIDIKGTFKSIYNLGKAIKEHGIFSCILEINYNKKNGTNTELLNTLYEWIKLNGYPYNHFYLIDYNNGLDFLPEDAMMLFAYDSLFCYVAYELYILSFYLKEEYDTDAIQDYLKYVEFLGISETLVRIYNDYNISYDFLMDEYQYNKIISILNKGLTEDTSNEYLDTVNEALTIILAYSVISRSYDFNIIMTKPFYLKQLNSYYLFETSPSIMGIAFYKLLINITSSEKGYNLKRCKNPNCRRLFKARYRREYCNSEECQRYRVNKKSNHWYHKQP